MVNYQHEILVELTTVHTLCIISVIAPVYASSILSNHPSNDKHQEILDKFPSTNYGEKNTSKITAKISNEITLTLHQVKFPVKTSGNSNGVKYLTIFLSG